MVRSIWDAVERAATLATLILAASMLWILATGRPLWRNTSASSGSRALPAAVEDLRDAQTVLAENAVGHAAAPIALIEFTDFECPYCQRYALETYSRIQREFVDVGRVRYALRHFPLPIHRLATKAGEAAECAGQQGRFWKMHDRLFENRGLGPQEIIAGAAALRLDLSQFRRCMDSPSTESQIATDQAEGHRLEIVATPTFIIGRIQPDGKTVRSLKRINGAQPYDTFKAVIVDALQATQPAMVRPRT